MRRRQERVSDSSQGDASFVCDEEASQASSDPTQPGRAGVRRARHSHLLRQSVRRQLLLQLRHKGTVLHYRSVFAFIRQQEDRIHRACELVPVCEFLASCNMVLVALIVSEPLVCVCAFLFFSCNVLFVSSASCSRSFSTGIVCTVMSISVTSLGIVLGVSKF